MNYLDKNKETTCSEEVGAKRWYAVHTYSGYENKVKKNLEKRVESMNMTEQILELSYLRRKKHKLKMVKPKSKNVPWLCTCRTSDDDESWYGALVQRLVGAKPNPLLPEEMRFILKQMGLKENNRCRIRCGRTSSY